MSEYDYQGNAQIYERHRLAAEKRADEAAECGDMAAERDARGSERYWREQRDRDVRQQERHALNRSAYFRRNYTPAAKRGEGQ